MESSYVHAGRRRAQSALGIVCLGLAALGVGFFQLQIADSPAQAAHADGTRLQAVPIPAARGVIVDRDGAILAEDVVAYALSIVPGRSDSVRAVLERLAPHLGLSHGDVQALLDRRRADPDQPLLVSRDVPRAVVAAIEAEPTDFRGVWAGVRHKRRYPAGPAAAHVVGMLGEADPSELRRPEFRAARTGALIGRAGAERQYEGRLAGTGGLTYVRVDAAGRVLGPVATHPGLAPTPGEAVQLSIDVTLQKRIAELVPAVARAGVVAIEPATGAVLALYSSPSFDPNLPDELVLGDSWAALRDDPAVPLRNRAIGTAYAPGFPWAVATAAAALRLGVIDGESHAPLACRGGMLYGDRYFRCADPRGHGSLRLGEALQQSCHVYFYQVALQLGVERVLEAGTRAGIGRPTGIDLPGENAGMGPAVRGGRERRTELEATEEALELSTGGGPVAVTALQLARLYAALVTDVAGTPRMLVADSPPAAADGDGLSLGPDVERRVSLLDGLRGSARSHGLRFEPGLADRDWGAIAGRSGGPSGSGHNWFVGVGGWGSDPKIVVVVVVEGRGNTLDAGQVAAGAVSHFLDRVAAGSLASDH
jgi:penicillin-binding protein 2